MNQFAFETWDSGKLTVNREFAETLRAAGLTAFDAIWNHTGGSIAKNLLKERTTTRLSVRDREGTEQVFYLKRHTRPPFKEYIKPLLRLTWPILGARPEWDAILRFHSAGIATMTPAALGESGGRSFLLTAAIEGCRKLSHLMDAEHHSAEPESEQKKRTIVVSIAKAAQTMHAAGMHHQDFYLTHLMVPESGRPDPLYVIDLGRVRHSDRLSRRWIVKDLAQLNYSAHHASRSERLRFFREYLGRPLTDADRHLLRSIARKSARIARHSRKNRL